ncbi:glycosyltransferase family 2 protein [Phormidesmis sp. 146-33]
MNQGSDRGDSTPAATISVVIPTANRHETIAQAVEKVFENTIQPFEVIVVDQSQNCLTRDALVDFIQANKITYLKDEGSGASRARNIGWKNASGEIIAFTDDDAQVDAQWLQNIRDTFTQTDLKIGILGGKIIPCYEDKNPNWSIPTQWEHLLPAYDQGDELSLYPEHTLPACVNYSICRSLLEKFSGFDEDLGPNKSREIQIYGEDSELALRLKQSNYSLVYNPACVVYHPVPLSRQSQNFLNKRLLSEGATYAYMRIKAKSDLLTDLTALFKSLVRYASLLLIGNRGGELHYLQGKILIMLKYGLLKQRPQTSLKQIREIRGDAFQA